MRHLGLILVALLQVPAFAWAEDAPRAEQEGPRELPWLRLELSGRIASPLRGRFKTGEDRLADGFLTAKDAHVPNRPALGLNAELDVEVLDWAGVGLVYWGLWQDAPRCSIHYEGLNLNGRRFAGGEPLSARLDAHFAEVSLRYVWVHRPGLRLWFGLGAAWGSLRLALRGAGVRATTRLQALFAPSLCYELAARPLDWLVLYFTSGIAVSPERFPSWASRFRVGLRLRLLPGVELVAGIGLRNLVFGDWRELIRKDVRPGHRWRHARVTNVGLDLGLSFSL